MTTTFTALHFFLGIHNGIFSLIQLNELLPDALRRKAMGWGDSPGVTGGGLVIGLPHQV